VVTEQGSCFLDGVSGVFAVRQAADRLVDGGVDEGGRRPHGEPELASRRHGNAVHHRRRFGALVLAVEDLSLPTGYLTITLLPQHRLQETPSLRFLLWIPGFERAHAAIQLPLQVTKVSLS